MAFKLATAGARLCSEKRSDENSRSGRRFYPSPDCRKTAAGRQTTQPRSQAIANARRKSSVGIVTWETSC